MGARRRFAREYTVEAVRLVSQSRLAWPKRPVTWGLGQRGRGKLLLVAEYRTGPAEDLPHTTRQGQLKRLIGEASVQHRLCTRIPKRLAGEKIDGDFVSTW